MVRNQVPRTRLLLFALFACLTISTLSAQSNQRPDPLDWPNWMGASHDGVSHESGWSVTWPEEGLATVWQHDIGIGFSSLAISQGRVVTMGHYAAGHPESVPGNDQGTEVVHCLDELSGKIVWQHRYPCKLVDVLYEGGPGCTPAIVGDFVYAVGKEGQLVCLRLDDGMVVWKVDLQSSLDVGLPEWGFNASPLVLDGKLYLEAGRLVCFDAGSGTKLWESEKHAAGYGGVHAFEFNEETLLASLDCDGLRVSRASDGMQLGFQDWKSPFGTNSTTPIVHEDKIFISTGYQIGCGLFRFSGDRLEEIYVNREMRNHFNNSILLEGNLYGFDGNSNLGRVVQLTCMNFATGDVHWKHKGLGCGSLMIADGRLVVLSDDGRLVVAKASSDGFEPLAEAEILSGRCWTMPVLVGGRVYARNAKGQLVCVNLPRDAG